MRRHKWDLVVDGLTSCESRRRFLALRKYPDGYRYNVKWKRHKLSPSRTRPGRKHRVSCPPTKRNTGGLLTVSNLLCCLMWVDERDIAFLYRWCA